MKRRKGRGKNENMTGGNKKVQILTNIVQRCREMHAHALAVVESWQICIYIGSCWYSTADTQIEFGGNIFVFPLTVALSTSFISRPSPSASPSPSVPVVVSATLRGDVGVWSPGCSQSCPGSVLDQGPLSLAYSSCCSSCHDVRRSPAVRLPAKRVWRHWLAVCATVPHPEYILYLLYSFLWPFCG